MKTDNTNKLVKRFVAPTMTRALELVQQELGPEAVILSSKRLSKGVEIVTSLEPDLPTRGIESRRQFGQKFDADVDTAFSSDEAWQEQAGIEKAAAFYGGTTEHNAEQFSSKSPEQLAKEIEIAREKMFAAKRKAQQQAQQQVDINQNLHAQSATKPTLSFEPLTNSTASVNGRESFSETLSTVTQEEKQQLESLKNDIADMRMLLEQQLWQMSDNRQQLTTVYAPQQVTLPNHFTVVTKHLSKLGLSEELVDELVAGIGHQLRANQAWRECVGLLSKRLPICQQSILDRPGIYAFLGQTGVGKTTTIAKLAAQYVLRHGAGKVALVTTDTYRVGAFDQLRTMGKILNVPVKVVDSENSLLSVLASLRQFPLILIDTAGFRLGDPLLKSQLAQLESSPSIHRVLVVSCNSQTATMKASLHAHKGSRGLYACVLTKLDESASIGEALSVVIKENLPIAYTTDGQNIPKDITQASAHGLVAKAIKVVKTQALSGEHSA
ncbi:flagellar biosynthesis protein FlhF [Agarilytica rhodophyticola]|uniref:flagellar biosynthesis protein FlhF n=1 Tax=Agarilytica rhodophyticola TaxID=1737490 RepID=UPI000B341DDE|nr:flagellar biosynthesis protein FlhF [Agarilytica rhodophyticola]